MLAYSFRTISRKKFGPVLFSTCEWVDDHRQTMRRWTLGTSRFWVSHYHGLPAEPLRTYRGYDFYMLRGYGWEATIPWFTRAD